MTDRNRAARSEGPCLAHPIRVTRSSSEPHIHAGSQATVDCEVQHREVPVTQCQQCERFKRVEVHEGAYVLLCRP